MKKAKTDFDRDKDIKELVRLIKNLNSRLRILEKLEIRRAKEWS